MLERSCRSRERTRKKKKKIQGFQRKRNTRFPSSFSFPSLHRTLASTSPSLLPRCWQDWERIANSSIFEREAGTKGNLARTRRLLTKPERKEKSIHIVIDQFLGPDALLRVSLLPIDFRQRRRILPLHDYSIIARATPRVNTEIS